MNTNSDDHVKTRKPELRERIHEVIFEADTFMGLAFDVALLLAILLSVIVVCIETVDSIQVKYGQLLRNIEWVLTGLFTIEYLLRLYCVQRPLKYATSFFGIVDLLAVLPTYVSLFFVNTPHLTVVRAFRLLRVFRIFKLLHFMKESEELGRAIMRARAKIIVFIGVVVVAITVAGTLMYEIENWGNDSPITFQSELEKTDRIQRLRNEIDQAVFENDFELAESALENLKDVHHEHSKSKFTSIPESMYWATVTMTTVGYGDIVPLTTLGKFVAAMLILLGYSLIIVPTGFVSAEFMDARRSPRSAPSTQSCPYCMLEGHDLDAVYCKQCGNPINKHSQH